MAYGKLRPDSYVHNTLLRYSGSEHFTFRRYVLLTNFGEYVEKFKALGEHEFARGHWDTVHNEALDCSLVNFGIGAPPAAMAMHCLAYLDQVDAVIMLGLAGGIADELEVGDLILPTASIRDEGASRHYLQSDTPALPNFKVQHVLAKTARDMNLKTRSGIFKTTDYRMWEFDEEFSGLLREQKVVAIDMEIAALFSVGYALGKPVGALMLVSDMPMIRSGIKRADSTRGILGAHCETQMKLGLAAVARLQKDQVFQAGEVLPFEW